MINLFIRTGSKRKTAAALHMGRKEFNAMWRNNNVDELLRSIPTNFKVGLVSDTHFGAYEQQISNLRGLYQYFKDANVDYVIHGGDLIDRKCYKPKRDGVWCNGEIIDWVIREYPRVGLQTIILAGNHDKIVNRRFHKNAVQLVCEKRNDFIYAGEDQAVYYINGLEFYLNHMNGIGEPDRLVTLFNYAHANEFDPDVIIAGHFHHWMIHPSIQGCLVIQLPAFASMSEVGAGVLHVGPVKYVEPIEVNILENDY